MKKKIEDIFHKERKKLTSFIKLRVSNDEDTEDILQEVFYKAIVNANILESIENIIGWLYIVAKNKITDWYRKKIPNTISIYNIEENNSFEEIIEDTMTNIEDDYIKSIIYDEIIMAINKLPEEQKEVFIANEIEGTTFKELQAKTGLSINTLLAKKRYVVLNLKRLSIF